MRIIGGRLKGKVIRAPKGKAIRPTSDRVRDSIFNIFTNGNPKINLKGKAVLDAFAGTGALGFEAISRGAQSAVFLDNKKKSLEAIKKNAETLGVTDQCRILQLDVMRPGFPPDGLDELLDLAFIDPPYGKDLARSALLMLAKFMWLKIGATVVVETMSKASFDPPAGYKLIKGRNYGITMISFLKLGGDEKL